MTDHSNTSPQTIPLFRLAFRPFFIGSALFVIAAILKWIAVLSGVVDWQSPLTGIGWHTHEMLFGFVCAVIVGFVLTAVQTWTGVPGLSGHNLFALFSLWFVARLVFWIGPDINVIWYVIPDAAFLLIAAARIGYSVIQAENYRNGIFVFALIGFCVLHALQVLFIFDQQHLFVQNLSRASLWLIALMISVVGGRVVPMFTANRLKTTKALETIYFNGVANVTLLIIVIITAVGWENLPTARWVFGFAALLHAFRSYNWWHKKVLSEPMLWSMHFSYLAIPITLATIAIFGVESWQGRQILHLLAIGCITTMVLSMISRVSLGHTGRPVMALKFMPFAFISLFLSAIFRSLWPSFYPTEIISAYQVSSVFFVFAFVCFLLHYIPILTRSRVDGKPG